LIVWSRVRRVRALVKCDDGETKHFFHHKGDSVGTWVCEDLENKACIETATEKPSEKDKN